MKKCGHCDGHGWYSVYIGGKGYTSRRCTKCHGTGEEPE